MSAATNPDPAVTKQRLLAAVQVARSLADASAPDSYEGQQARHYAHECEEALREALRRVEAGTYGICIDCAKAIHPARRRRLPFTLRCAACA